RCPRVHLDAPDLFAFLYPRHFEQYVRAYPPLEGRVEVCGEVGREDQNPVEALELLYQDGDDGVGFASKPVVERGGSSRRDRICLVEQQDGVFLAGETEGRDDVFRCLAHPHRLHFALADDEEPAAERMGDRLRADRFAGPWGTSEIEGERQARRMSLAQTPSV